MTEIQVNKQVESSEVQTGFCRFCGQGRQFETSGMCGQEELDEWATEKCGCGAAEEERRRQEQEEKALENIRKLFGEHDAAKILQAAVHPVAVYAVDSVTVGIGGVKAAIKMTGKGKIQIKKTTTMEEGSGKLKSIMQKKDGTCYLCRMLHADYGKKQTQEHHALHGMGRRRLSEKYGLKVYLCLRHHTADGGPEAVHRNAQTDRLVKRQAQKAFMRKWPELDFMELFGRSYLEGEERWQQVSGKKGIGPGFRFIEVEEDNGNIELHNNSGCFQNSRGNRVNISKA